jgi:S-adenosylmethionine/arginine decarboxylase-like enzyme
MPLHNHLLVNGYTNTPFDHEALAINWMKELVEEIDMKIVQGPFASYVEKEGNRGLTATVMIETSHIAMHIWDEQSPAFVQFDLYTCSSLPVRSVLNNLELNLGLFDYTSLVIERSSGFNIIDPERWNQVG